MKNILIPTDFSPNAWNAVVYAMQFLKDENCKFYFLHTYTPSFYRLDYMIGGPEFSAIPDYEVDVSVEGLEKTIKNPTHEKHIDSHRLFAQCLERCGLCHAI